VPDGLQALPLSRRALFALCAAPLLAGSFAPAAGAADHGFVPGFPAAPNSAVVKSLQALERRRSAVRGDAETRLGAALDQLQRSRALADTEEPTKLLEARGLLREGGMKSLRVDAAAFAAAVPAWDTGARGAALLSLASPPPGQAC
jgi:hypothetical protein